MAHHSDPFPLELAHRASAPSMERTLVRVLEHHWDPDGAIARALATRPDGLDPTRPRSMLAVAREATALLAAGGTESDVGGYLRREEFAVLTPPTDEADAARRRDRRERTRGAFWRIVRGIGRPGDVPENVSAEPPSSDR